MLALGTWGERWMELAPEHIDPGVVLSSWVRWYLAVDRLPGRAGRGAVRLPGPDAQVDQLWILFDGARSEVCRTFPGYAEDVIVTIGSRTLARRMAPWSPHVGRCPPLRSAQDLRRPALRPRPASWNRLSGWARMDDVRPMRPRRTDDRPEDIVGALRLGTSLFTRASKGTREVLHHTAHGRFGEVAQIEARHGQYEFSIGTTHLQMHAGPSSGRRLVSEWQGSPG